MKYVLLIFLLLLLLLLLTKIQVAFGLRNRMTSIKIKIGFFSFQPGKKEEEDMKEKEEKEDSQPFLQKMSAYKRFWKESKPHVKKALQRAREKLRIEILNFSYVGGFENAAVTAVAYGVVSGLFYDIYAMIQHFVGVEQSKVQMLPDFQKSEVRIELDVLISIRVWQILWIGVALLPIVRIKKRMFL